MIGFCMLLGYCSFILICVSFIYNPSSSYLTLHCVPSPSSLQLHRDASPGLSMPPNQLFLSFPKAFVYFFLQFLMLFQATFPYLTTHDRFHNPFNSIDIPKNVVCFLSIIQLEQPSVNTY